jgi:hypothetical protein
MRAPRVPKSKKTRTPKKIKGENLGPIDTRTPLMFRDELPAEKLKAAKKISDLRNLGPTMEKVLYKAGVKTVDQFVKLGWQKAMGRLILIHPRYMHAICAYALIGALKNVDWNRISPGDKAEALQLMAKLRQENPKKKKARTKTGSQSRSKVAKKK